MKKSISIPARQCPNRVLALAGGLLAMALVLISLTDAAQADWMSLTEGAGQVQVCKITQPATSSDTAVSGPCAFYGIVMKVDGTNNTTLNIYDNTGASGNRLIPADLVIPGTDYYFSYSLNPAVKCTNGVHVTVSGGTVSYQVLYDN